MATRGQPIFNPDPSKRNARTRSLIRWCPYCKANHPCQGIKEEAIKGRDKVFLTCLNCGFKWEGRYNRKEWE